LQFLAKPDLFRKDLDLKGLSESARKSLTTLKRWQQAAGCHDHPLVFSTIDKIADFSDDCHSAIRLTLTVAQKGHSFATNVSTFCDALTKKYNSLEHLEEHLLKLNKLAQKGYGRSIEAHGKLICLHVGLCQVSESIPSIAAKIEEDVLRSQGHDPDAPLNGLSATFVSIPPTVFQTYTGPSAHNGLDALADSDDEDATAVPSSWLPTYSPSYPRNNWLTFMNVIDQVNRISKDVSQMIEHVGRCVEWWSRMKATLEALQGDLRKAVQDGPRSLQIISDDTTDGWNEIADQFALYVYRTSPIMTDNFSNAGQRIYPATPPRAWSPPPRAWSPAPIICEMPLPPVDIRHTEKPQSLWKRLSCVS
jgi:hypothetical protein